MSLKNVLLVFVCLLLGYNGHTQTIPEGYDSLTTLESPQDSINDAAGNLMLSADEKYLVVQYSYKPTYIYVFEVGSWKLKRKFELKGHNFIYNSYFSDDGKYFYTTPSGKLSEPKQLNLETGEIAAIPCKKTPKGCDYQTDLKVGDRIFTEDESFLFVISPDPDFKVQVWKKVGE